MNKILPELLVLTGLALWILSLFLPTFYPSDFRSPPHFASPETGLQVLTGGTMFLWNPLVKGQIEVFLFMLVVPLLWGLYANPFMLAAMFAFCIRRLGFSVLFACISVIVAQTSWMYFFFTAQASNDLAPPALRWSSTGFFAWDASIILLAVGMWGRWMQSAQYQGREQKKLSLQ